MKSERPSWKQIGAPGCKMDYGAKRAGRMGDAADAARAFGEENNQGAGAQFPRSAPNGETPGRKVFRGKDAGRKEDRNAPS